MMQSGACASYEPGNYKGAQKTGNNICLLCLKGKTFLLFKA